MNPDLTMSQTHDPLLPRRRLLAASAALALLPGCALDPDRDHDGAEAPRSAPLPRPPRTAWVFSSGGPRGFVHVGVLKAMDELGLVPDLVVGASVGAMVGVLYAGGLPARDIERLALDLQPWTLASLAVGGEERFSGAPLAGFVREQTGERLLQRLRIPAACVAQRLPPRGQGDRLGADAAAAGGGGGAAGSSPGEVVAFTHGDAGLAVQAASAIEGQFVPVRIRGRRYADADLRMPLPVRMARALGAERVLAVDASAHEERAPPGSEGWREGDLRKRALTRPDAALADVLLHPEFGYWVSLKREFRERAIDAGYRATMAAAPRLRALHGA
jgi:NTE family protein